MESSPSFFQEIIFMSRHLSVLSNLIIVLQVFLLVFCFVDVSVLPPYVMFAGRFHPVVLHLPITLIILLIPFSFYVQKRKEQTELNSLFELLLHYIALIATLTALAGFLLAAGGGYEAEALQFHKWLGVAIAFISHALLYLRKAFSSRMAFWNTSLLATLVLTIAGSHYGGTLTHGEGFFAFNDKKESGVVIPTFTEKTTVFAGAVQPVLMAKCAYCHNDQKMKGGLNMKDIASMIKGGKNGAMWVSGDPEKSLMIQRMLLDLDDKNHMPPKGKTQLSSAEMHLFAEWIRAGSNPKTTYHSLAETDTLKKIIAKIIETRPVTKEEKVYSFSAASASKIQELNTPFRRILPVAANSPALVVKFYLKEKYDASMLKEINSIKTQVVEVNLSNMPADDNVISALSSFENIERINLNGTAITGKTLGELNANKHLEQISLATTQVDKSTMEALAKIPSLKKVFLWNSKVTIGDATELKKKYPAIVWDLGYVPDAAERLKLTPPFPVDVEKIILEKGDNIVLKHPLPGVQIRYTLDGTEPDSVNGKVYTEPLGLNGMVHIIAIATSEGWANSNSSNNTFFEKGLYFDSARLITPPSDKYKAKGARSLNDGKKGFPDNLSMNLLGYQDNPFKAGFYFNQAKPINQIILSVMQNSGAFVLPPEKIIIKGGDSPANAKIIGTLNIGIPKKDPEVNINVPLAVSITKANYRYIEIEAYNITKLPKWHNGSGQKGWVFLDEVFFY